MNPDQPAPRAYPSGDGFAVTVLPGAPRMLRGRPSGLKGRCAIASGDPACGRSLDPGDLYGPFGQELRAGRGPARAGARRTDQPQSQDQKTQDHYMERW
jgi:hypothetical protein